MKKLKKFLLAGLCGLVLTSAAGLVACGSGEKEINVIGGEYTYKNPVRQTTEVDDGFKIDGILDEVEYTTVKSGDFKKRYGYETADVKTTVYFGEKGLYFGFVNTENNRIYYNEERGTTIGSGIEMYLFIGGKGYAENNQYHSFEIDLTCGGRINLKRYACFVGHDTGRWVNCYRPDVIEPILGVTAQGGEINTPECTGYTLEFFMPYDYFVDLGLLEPGMKPTHIYMNPAHVKSNSAVASDSSRTWWSLTQTQLSNYNYGRPDSWYKFDENGLVTNDIIINYSGTGSGIVTEQNGYTNMPNGNSVTFNIVENEGSAIKSFKVNGVERIKDVRSDGAKGTYYLAKVDGNIVIDVEFEEMPDITHAITGSVAYTGETLEWDDIAYDLNLYAIRSIKEIEIDFDRSSGVFYEDLPEGDYKFILRTNNGETVVSYDLSLYSDEEIDIELTDDNYGPTRVVNINTAYTAGPDVTLYEGMIDNDNFVMKLYFGTEFGAKGPATIAQYVAQINIVSEAGTQTMQLLRWNNSYQIKFHQGAGGMFDLDAATRATYLAQQGIYLILVREAGILNVYVDDGNGNLKQLVGDYHTAISDNIVSLNVKGYDGVSAEARVYVDEAKVKLGTTDYRYFNDKVVPKFDYDEDSVNIEGLKDGYYSLGETINLNITPKDEYMIYNIYYNGKKVDVNDEGTYSFISGLGAMFKIEAVKVESIAVDCNEMENGTITFDKDIESYSLGDDITFYLEGEDGYRVGSVFINGKDVTTSYTKIDKTGSLLRYYYSYDRCLEKQVYIEATFEESSSAITFDDVTIKGQGANFGTRFDVKLLDDEAMWIGTLGFDPAIDLSVIARWHISVRLYAGNGDFIEIQLLRWDGNVMFKMMYNCQQSGHSTGTISDNASVYQALLRDHGLKVLAHYKGTAIDVYACNANGQAVKIINNYSLAGFENSPIVAVMYFKAESSFSDKEAYITDSALYGMTGLSINISTNEPENGNITFTEKDYSFGDSVEFTVTPDNGYIIDTLFLNGEAVEVDDDYKVKVVCIDVPNIVLEATFIETPKADVTLSLDVDIDDGKEFTFVNKLTQESFNVTLNEGKLVLSDVEYGTYAVSFVLNGVDVSANVKIDGATEAVLAVSTIANVPASFDNAENYDVNAGDFKVEGLTATTDYSYKTAISGEFWAGAKVWLKYEDYVTATTSQIRKDIRFGIKMLLNGNAEAGVVISIENKLFNLLSMKDSATYALSGSPIYANALTGDGLYLIINRKANGTAVVYVSTDGKGLVELTTFNGIGATNIIDIGACFWYAENANYQVSYNANVSSFMVGTTLAEVLGGATITPTSETEGKGEVIFDKAVYDIGDDVNIEVTCTADKTSIVGVTINGVDYTSQFTKGETWTLTLNHSLLPILDVVVSYETQRAITATITVGDTYGDLNGMRFIFKDHTTGDTVANVILHDSTMAIEDVYIGTILDAYISGVSGTTVYLGQYTVTSEAAKELPVDDIFVKGQEILGYTTTEYDIKTGNFAIDSGSETSKVANFAYNTNIEGDVCVAVKFTSSTALDSDYEWLDTLNKAIQLGVYMTVDGSSDDIGLSILLRRNNDDEGRVVQNNNINTVLYGEDGMDFSDALADGIWLVIRRDATTGNIYSWIGVDVDHMVDCGIATGAIGNITGLGVCFYSETKGGLAATATEFAVNTTLESLGFGNLGVD